MPRAETARSGELRVVDPWREIEVRPAPDAGGKSVDVHVRPDEGRTFVFSVARSLGRDRLLQEVVIRLRRIRDARAKTIRDRRFNLWYGTARSVAGEELEAIMIPDPFDFATWKLLADLGDLPGHLEGGRFPVAELDGGPLARYDHGQITVYLAASASAAGWDEDVEVRSATVTTPERHVPTKWILPPSGRSPRWHDQDVWDANRIRILKLAAGLQAAGSYSRLAQVTERHLGIAVREQLAAADRRYGLLRVGFVDTRDFSVPVAVFLRHDLPDGLKYIVLAHELAHYTFHFPLLYLGALIDDLARLVPEAAPVFDAAVARYVDRDALENQADHLASAFLIPAMYDLNQFADMYMEVGRRGGPSARELAWRFLQPLIPGAVDEAITWRNVEQMSELAAKDLTALADAPTSLYARMLKATVERMDGARHDPDHHIEEGLAGLQETFDRISTIVTTFGVDGARVVLLEEIAESEAAPVPASVPDDMHPERYDELAPAVPLPAGVLARALHLVPASSNPDGDRNGAWLDRHHPDEPPLTIDGWRDLLEDDVVLRLYRHEAWQPPLRT